MTSIHDVFSPMFVFEPGTRHCASERYRQASVRLEQFADELMRKADEALLNDPNNLDPIRTLCDAAGNQMFLASQLRFMHWMVRNCAGDA